MSELDLPGDPRLAVFSLNSGRSLLERVCRRLGVSPGTHEERDFEDGEHKIRPLEDVSGRDVYVVQSLYGDETLSVDEKLTRLLFFIAALGDAGAERVTAVVPYLCYSRKDRRTKARDPVTSRYVAALFEAVGTGRVVTVDVHNPAAYENAFRIPTVHLTAARHFVDALVPLIGDEPVIVVSPDAGGAKRAERLREALERRLGREVPSAFVEKFRSEGVVRGGAVVGAVEGRVAVIVDDLVSSGTTLARAASACRARGARRAYAAATHAVFSAEANRSLGRSDLERIVVLDTIPPRRFEEDLLQGRLCVLDCTDLLAGAIRGLHTNGSLPELAEA
ncbi:MAG TPA: ribose-phosphate diphosphokinase [Polyangiaceae bacterium]|nr:ribose-phosphate diphosphokinase [Polyangiaceae bacterium]